MNPDKLFSTFSSSTRIIQSFTIFISITFILLLSFSFFPPRREVSLSMPGLIIRRNYSNYNDYISRQLNKTLNPKLREIWTTRDWRRKVDVFSRFFRQLREDGLLKNESKCLCIGARVGQEVLALREIGISDSIGIDLVPYPPLVLKGDFHKHPYRNETFDFEFSNVFDHALYPNRFVSEIERTLRRGGVAVLHLTIGKKGDKYSANDLFDVKPLMGFFKESELVHVKQIDGFGLDTEVVFRKKTGSRMP